mgnify:CR=1 FL=1
MIYNQDNSNLIIIEKKNEVYITVDCESDVQREISEFFTFYVPGYKFMPAYRTRMWDGKIRLFSQKTKEIYFGLYPYIKAFAEERGYNIVAAKDVEIDNKVDKEQSHIVGIVTERDIVKAIAHHQIETVSRKVDSIMSKKLISVNSETQTNEAVGLMIENQIRHLAVIDKEKLVGVISMRDIFYSLNLLN